MKKLFALLFTLGVTLGSAATANAQALKVNVPFDFVVNGSILPASTYFIREALSDDEKALLFEGERQGSMAKATDLDSTITGTRLVFRRVGDQYFLGDVVTLGGKLHFAPSRNEKEQARAANTQSLTVSAE